MQSDDVNHQEHLTEVLRLEFKADTARRPDPLMGWTSIDGTQSQVGLTFDTKEQAIAYAEKHGIDAKVFEPRERSLKLRAYSDNFAHNRVV